MLSKSQVATPLPLNFQITSIPLHAYNEKLWCMFVALLHLKDPFHGVGERDR